MLVHNIDVYTYVFNAHLKLPGGTTVTINVLHHTLTKMKAHDRGGGDFATK